MDRVGEKTAAQRRLERRKAYTAYLRSKAWQALRAKVIFRDSGQCRAALAGGKRCGSRQGVEVHHLTYARFGAELMTDLVVLCHDCHKRAHGRGKYRAGGAKTKRQ